MSFTTYLVGVREGTVFGAIAAGFPALVMAVYAILIRFAYDQSWAFAVSLGSGTALVCSALICLFVWLRGALVGLQVGFVFLVSRKRRIDSCPLRDGASRAPCSLHRSSWRC
eukprot:5733431-Prymnesium_polylepis.2